MAAAAFLLVPLLVLAGSWYLLTAFDGAAAGRRQALLGAGCFVAAVVLTVVGMALDDRPPSPAKPRGTTGAGV
ncbi:MAG: hypothetical protein ABR549_09030 [Mycobacteriales bacterium]